MWAVFFSDLINFSSRKMSGEGILYCKCKVFFFKYVDILKVKVIKFMAGHVQKKKMQVFYERTKKELSANFC